MSVVYVKSQDWADKDKEKEKEEGGWRKRTDGGDSEWRRPVPDRCVGKM